MNNFIHTDHLKNLNSVVLKKTEANIVAIKTDINALLKGNDLNKTAGSTSTSPNLFRLYVKNNEYVYAKSNDIVLLESCDHLVKVYLAFGNTVKKVIRKNTLKDFLLLLPENQFARLGRFCAINMHRLSGGNYKSQTFEFDYNFSIKLAHHISNAVFNNIGK